MKKLLFFAIGIWISIVACADGIQFSAWAPQTVEVGEQFYLKYELNQRLTPQLPDLKGFTLMGGPSTGTSTSVQIINGNMSQSNTYSYSYILRANSEGTFTIPGGKVVFGGQTYTSNAVTVKVVKAGSKPKQNTNRAQSFWGNDPFYNQQPAQAQEIKSDDVFIRTEVDKTSVYQGDKITATIKIYTKVDLVGFEDFRLPGFDGFWAQEVKTPEQIQFQQVQLNGTNYMVGVLKKDILYPQRSGTLSIGSVGADIVVRQRVNGGQSIYDNFFGYYQNKQLTINSPEVKITVKPLPGNAPGYFTGAVGSFTVAGSISADSVKVNDALTMKITISGTGNLKLIDPPDLNFPKEFEVFDPVVQLNLNSGDGEIAGSQVFEYTLIPRYPGDYNTNEIRFAYFDPVAGIYKTLKTNSYNIHVYKMPGDSTGQFSSDYSRSEINYIGSEDIRFIETENFTPEKNRKFFIGSPLFIVFASIPLIAFIVVVMLLRKKIKENANIEYTKNRKANKTTMKRLKKANELLKNNLTSEFYKEVMVALWGYLSDKLNLPLAQLSKENVSLKLADRGLEPELTDTFLKIIEDCELAHFAPVEGSEQPLQIFDRAVDIINLFEQKLKIQK